MRPLVEAMRDDAFKQPYLCVDATGVLVLAKERCRAGHFWVTVAPDKHVLFAYSKRHDGAAVDELLGGYSGYLVADAHAVYDHLYRNGDVIEVGCWAHARRYFFKALESDPERAKTALAWIGALFALERSMTSTPAKKRREIRQARAAPIVDAFFAWCDQEAGTRARPVSDGSGDWVRAQPARGASSLSRRRAAAHAQQHLGAEPAPRGRRPKELALRRQRRRRRGQRDRRVAPGQLQPAQDRALRVRARPALLAPALAQSPRPRARSRLLARDPRETRHSAGPRRQRPSSRRPRSAGRCLASPTRTTPTASAVSDG